MEVSGKGGTGGRVAYGEQTAALSVASWQRENIYHTNRSILMPCGGEAGERTPLERYLLCLGTRSPWKRAFAQILLRGGSTAEN